MTINWDGFQESFMDFIPRPKVQTKDEGLVHLKLYDAQRYFFDEVFDGLRHDVHNFVCAKGRQLGITTGCQLFDVFYAGAIPNIQGVIVFDSDGNKEKFRTLITGVIDTLPETHALPISKGGNNRRGLVFQNGNMLDYLVAGTKKGSGNLGRSRAYNYGHLSECAYYGDEEAVETFINTLSQIYEYRCYFWESTGNGWNLFSQMWEDAVSDTISQKAIFVTWWRKRTYSYAKGTPLFNRYGWSNLSVDEREAQSDVLKQFGQKITLEQWAWYRHQADPRAVADADPSGDTKRELVGQEHPHTPDMCFRSSGSPFIPGALITPAMARAQKVAFKGYRYYLGDDISTIRLEKVKLVNQAHLRVWQEPSPIGVYIVGADPAYGLSDQGDGFAIQVVRCYADKMVQVAEFCDRNIQPYQFAWILLHLCGMYGDCRYILELNGPGEAVWTELKNLKRRVEDGTLSPPTAGFGVAPTEDAAEMEARQTYSRVRQYLFRRSDSLGGGGYNYHMRCLALDTPLPTPIGWTSIGEVKSGDVLFDEKGEPCTVTETSEVHLNHECYRVTFDDGSSIIADADHRWELAGGQIVRTLDLKHSGGKIQMMPSLKTEPADLKIDPYILGLWLGDGTSTNASYTMLLADMEEMEDHIRAAGYKPLPPRVSKSYPTLAAQTMSGLTEHLDHYGLRKNKHIPDDYLRASVEQRIELLKGLMDTDGTIGIKAGYQCSFTTTSELLRVGFSELLRSLGIKAKAAYHHRDMMYRGQIVRCAPSYQFYFQAYFVPFKLRRKAEKIKYEYATEGFRLGGIKRSQQYRVVAIDEVPSEPVRCLSVNSPSNLFLAGHAMVPTHNSSLETKFTFMTQMADRFMLGELEVNSVPCLKEMQGLRKDGRSIEAEGKGKDDRPLGLGLCTRAYIDDERPSLVSRHMTFEVEQTKASEGGETMTARYMTAIMDRQYALKGADRRAAKRRASGRGWGW
jgi:LAGLIDADG-like domain